MNTRTKAECARCEAVGLPLHTSETAPYHGKQVCGPCETTMAEESVPEEPLSDSISRECLADVLRRIRDDVRCDSTASITWRNGAMGALERVANEYGIHLNE